LSLNALLSTEPHSSMPFRPNLAPRKQLAIVSGQCGFIAPACACHPIAFRTECPDEHRSQDVVTFGKRVADQYNLECLSAGAVTKGPSISPQAVVVTLVQARSHEKSFAPCGACRHGTSAMARVLQSSRKWLVCQRSICIVACGGFWHFIGPKRHRSTLAFRILADSGDPSSSHAGRRVDATRHR